MFQRLSSLFFGSVEEVTPELKGPNPCVTEADEEGWLLVNVPEGATAEASPMEDLLIEHPSMSVYVSAGPLPPVEESTTSLAGSISRMSESAMPAMTRSSMTTRVTRGAAAQAGALAKVTQVSRVQRAKARTERRHLARNRIQRQNRVREQVQRRTTHTRNSFLHQPCQRNICH
ncbi:tumor protein p53-inducible nuclear protein 2 isoform X3 [Megalobrama amblycephala]|uniref:tumor protein p53-inducible nuclear protein 2 isoform X3 n=1 Tax=Megalobrama amblycephala TaxID=75352 RepID=UPI0020145FEC|nr:tumor protein p53-inducible nuclear protein 2 isoform X3 [Megalobrama amblycephala]